MARTSARAKKSKEEVNGSKKKSQSKSEQDAGESDNGNVTNDLTDKENDESNFEVEKIVHTRVYKGKRQYLIRWKGYKEDSDTWENESAVLDCPDILETFKKDNPNVDNNTERENSEQSNKKGHTSTKRVGTDKVKRCVTSSNEQSKTESEEEEIEKDDSEKKGKKRVNTETAKKTGKKLKAKSGDSSVKEKDHKSEGSDDESVTDGKNYEVEKILEVHTKKDGSHEFLIRWKGYRASDDTWEPEAHLNCHELIEKFMEKVNKAKNIPARELRESRTQRDRYVPRESTKKRGNLRNLGFRPSYAESYAE